MTTDMLVVSFQPGVSYPQTMVRWDRVVGCNHPVWVLVVVPTSD